MNHSRQIAMLLFVVPVMAITIGCGGAGRVDGEYPVHSASGTITQKGQPLDSAQVIFYHEEKGKPPARGTTDSSGRFTLTTYNQGDGAVTGNFKVTVKKVVSDGPQVSDDEPIDPKVGEKMQVKSLVPAKYGSPATTDLKATVKESDNSFEFDVE